MRVGAALAVCAALGLAAPSAAAADGAHPDAPSGPERSTTRYTLSMTYTATTEYEDHREVCGWGSPIHPATDPVWVCSVEDTRDHEMRSYTARSVRPFDIVRSEDAVRFTADMAGGYQQVGDGTGWWNWWTGGRGRTPETWTTGRSATGEVTGTVHAGGAAPSRVVTDLSASADPAGTQSRVTCSPDGCQTSTTPFPGGFLDSAWLTRITPRMADGEAFTVTAGQTTLPAATPGTIVREGWRLRFTPVAERVRTQRWRIEVRGRDRWSWGMATGLRGGVDVDWAHVTTLEVADGRVTDARGRVRVLGVRDVSEPYGAFEVTHEVTTRPAYSLARAVKRGNRVALRLWRGNRAEYRVAMSVTVAGPQVLDQFRRIGIADPEATYRAVVARGTVRDVVRPTVPSSPRLEVPLRSGTYAQQTEQVGQDLPCTPAGADETDCVLRRGGQIITVTRVS